MVDRAVAERLLGLVQQYLRDLEPLRGMPVSAYLGDVRTRRFAERTIQIAIEACLDLGHHVIADEGYREPRDNRDVFRVLTEAGILPSPLLPNLENMASFRNLIVHSYGSIDDRLVHGILQRRLQDLSAFADAICAHLGLTPPG